MVFVGSRSREMMRILHVRIRIRNTVVRSQCTTCCMVWVGSPLARAGSAAFSLILTAAVRSPCTAWVWFGSRLASAGSAASRLILTAVVRSPCNMWQMVWFGSPLARAGISCLSPDSNSCCEVPLFHVLNCMVWLTFSKGWISCFSPDSHSCCEET